MHNQSEGLEKVKFLLIFDHNPKSTKLIRLPWTWTKLNWIEMLEKVMLQSEIWHRFGYHWGFHVLMDTIGLWLNDIIISWIYRRAIAFVVFSFFSFVKFWSTLLKHLRDTKMESSQRVQKSPFFVDGHKAFLKRPVSLHWK